MSSRTVNIVCSHYPPHSGGIERFAYLQAKAMVKMGLKVNVITNDTDKLGFSHLEEGIEVYRLSFLGLFDDRLPIPYRMKQLTTVYKLCFSHQIDLVIVHGRYYPLSLLGCIASQMRTCRLLLIDHSSGYIGFSNHLLSFFSRLYEHAMTSALKLSAPRFFGVSGACNKWLLNFGE
jgi:glycosyltransferase involved in cell wall biosynthesis